MVVVALCDETKTTDSRSRQRIDAAPRAKRDVDEDSKRRQGI